MTHYMVVSFPRCGTTIATKMLDVNRAFDEVLNPIMDVDADTMNTVATGLRRSKLASSDVIVRMNERIQQYLAARSVYQSTSVKKFYYDNGTVSLGTATRVICLRRKDPLAVFLSLQIAAASGVFAVVPNQTVDNDTNFAVSPEDYAAFKPVYANLKVMVHKQFEGYPIVDLWYEDLVAITEAQDIQGLPFRAVASSGQVARNSEQLYDRVLNLHEVYSWFQEDVVFWKEAMQ